MSAAEKRPNFFSIQMWRGIGALVIAFGHSAVSIKGLTDQYWTYATADRSWGLLDALHTKLYLGVDLFFCASGFIMAMLILHGGEDKAGFFFWRRVSRIYPAYWFFTIPVILAFLINPSFNFGLFTGDLMADIKRIALSAILIPQQQQPVLGVAWTLVHEMQFYLVLAAILLLGLKRYLYPIVGAVTAASVVVYLLDMDLAWGQVLGLYWVEFFAGMVIYRVYPTLSRYRPGLQALASLGVYAAVAMILDNWGDHTMVSDVSLTRMLGISLMGLLLFSGGIGMERVWSANGPVISRIRLLGDASYSLYLSHFLTMSLIGKLYVIFLPKGLPLFVCYGLQAAAILAATVVALSIHVLIEKPFNRWVQIFTKTMQQPAQQLNMAKAQ